MKKIVEVQTQNAGYRKFGISADFPMPAKGYHTGYDKVAELPEPTKKIVTQLKAMEAIKEVSAWPGEIGITLKLAWADDAGWSEVADEIRKAINDHFFNGEAEYAFRAQRD